VNKSCKSKVQFNSQLALPAHSMPIGYFI